MTATMFEEGSETPLGEAAHYLRGPPLDGITTIVLKDWSGPRFSPHKKYEMRRGPRVLATAMQLASESNDGFTFLAVTSES